MEQSRLKSAVREFWDKSSCGELAYAVGSDECAKLRTQALTRFQLEPYIHGFAKFEEGRGRDILEIGVGMGADHAEWERVSPRSLHGIDLTPRAVGHTTTRLQCEGLFSELRVGDAEALPYPDNSFDIVYSWGVLHHSPNTPQAFAEVLRVLRPGGVARIMIYHTWSFVGYMLWVRYALMAGRPWTPLRAIYGEHLESPGTKAYGITEARALLTGFSASHVRSLLSFGDLLQGAVGQRHNSMPLRIARAVWPRWLLRRLFPHHGLYLLIEAQK